MKSDVGTLEDLLKANAAHIAELKERVALLEGKLLLKSSVEEDSKGAVTSSLHARSAASTMIDLKTVASLTAGTRDQPWELSDSDDEQKGSKASTSASHSAKAALVEPSSRNIDADVIESTVSDSEFMLAEQENVPVTNMRKRGRAGSLPSLGAPSSVSIGESAGLSASSSRKHRKLNHADDPDMKPFSGGPKSEHVESVLPDIEPVHHTRTKKYANLLPESHLKVEEKVDQVHEVHEFDPELEAPPVAPNKEEEHLPNSLDKHQVALAKLANPKAEIKKEFLLKDEDVLQLLHPDALQPYPITLSGKLRSVTVTRRQLSKRYGGSEMDTFPKPGAKKRTEHGYDNFMCINLLWNPNAPQVPGHGGLFFDTSLPGDPWTRSKYHSERQVLFVRLGDAKWLYLGLYEVSPAPSLTSAQWRSLPDAVRAVWTKNIYQKNWGKSTRARIHLRRTLGREPTHDDVERAQGDFKDVTEEQIGEALAAGHECICTWSMKCVGYDEEFQHELIDLARN